MSKRTKIIGLSVIILIVVVLIAKVVFGGPVFASAYTKVALKKNFSTAFNAHTNPQRGATPMDIQSGSAPLSGNVLVYVYYAYQDYQAGHISKKQFLEVMQNTKGAIQNIENRFTVANKIVLAYPIENKDTGDSYVETEADGTHSWNTVNFTNLQPIIMNLISQMYQSQDPEQIYDDVKQYAVYMEQGTFYYQYNTQYGLDQINVGSFKPQWLFNNTNNPAWNMQSVLKSIVH